MPDGSSLGEAYVEVRARLDKLDGDLGKAKTKTEQTTSFMGRSFDRVKKSVSGLGLAIGGLSVAAATIGLTALVKRAVNAAEEIADMADKIGISTERLQELRFAFTQNGATISAVDAALIKFNVGLSQFATTGKGEAAEALKLIGINSVQSARALGTNEQALNEVLRRLAEIPNDAQRTAAAFKLFGEQGGPALAILLRQGEGAVDGLAQKARELGIVLEGDAVRAAAAASAQLRALGETISGQLTGALIELAPQITAIVQGLSDSLPVILNWIQSVGAALGLLTDTNAQKDAFLEIGAAVEASRQEVEQLEETLEDMGSAGGAFGAFQRRARSGTEEALADARARLAANVAEQQRIKAALDADLPGAGGQVFVAEPITVSGNAADFGGGGGEGGGAKKAAVETASEYERLIDALREKQLLMRDELQLAGAEEEVRSRLRVELEAVRIARELENAAIKDGVEITPALRAEIDAAAGAYMDLAAQIVDTTDSQRLAAEQTAELEQRVGDLGNALVSSLQEAEDGVDFLKRFGLELVRIGLQSDEAKNALTSLFNSIASGSSGGGIFETVFGAIASGVAGGFGGSAGGISAGIELAKGGAIDRGHLTAFASGGIVSAPTLFPMARGMGLMGEAGPEAIMPLKRGADGSLGVEASGGAINVVINNSAGADVSARRDGGALVVDVARRKSLEDVQAAIAAPGSGISQALTRRGSAFRALE